METLNIRNLINVKKQNRTDGWSIRGILNELATADRLDLDQLVIAYYLMMIDAGKQKYLKSPDGSNPLSSSHIYKKVRDIVGDVPTKREMKALNERLNAIPTF
jgi:hypothetical protein